MTAGSTTVKQAPFERLGDTLGLARSNVSTGLKELQGWNLLRARSFPGDRREFFDVLGNVWQWTETPIVASPSRRRLCAGLGSGRCSRRPCAPRS